MLAGRGVGELGAPPPVPADVNAYGQAHEPSPAHPLVRDPAVAPATDDWPFLYMRSPGLPRHYLGALAVVLSLSALAVWLALATSPGRPARPALTALAAPRWSWH